MTNTTEKKTFDPLADGEYLLRMNRFEEVTNSKGNQMIKSSYQVISKVGDTTEGKGINGRLIFENFHIEASEKAMEVSRSRLDKYLKAVGVDTGLEEFGGDLTGVATRLETPFIATLVTKKSNNPKYQDSNFVQVFSRR